MRRLDIIDLLDIIREEVGNSKTLKLSRGVHLANGLEGLLDWDGRIWCMEIVDIDVGHPEIRKTLVDAFKDLRFGEISWLEAWGFGGNGEALGGTYFA